MFPGQLSVCSIFTASKFLTSIVSNSFASITATKNCNSSSSVYTTNDRFYCFNSNLATRRIAELVLKQEQEEYRREGIVWENIEYSNNQIICDLVEQQHKGMLAIMDEACLNVGRVTDQMLLEAMDQKLSQHKHYTSRKLSPMDKELRHGSDFRIR